MSEVMFIPDEPETWKDILGYEGCYQASTMGRIKTLSRYRKNHHGGRALISEKIKAQARDKDGYLVVCLSVDRKKSMMRVHRAVCLAFHPNPENKPFVNHKNGIKDDNRKSNVEWATQSENELHAHRTGIKKPSLTMLGRTGSLHPNPTPVAEYDLLGNEIKVYGGMAEAARENGVNRVTIRRWVQGKAKSRSGHIWKYIKKQNDN